jgi:hypothetical protein
MKTKRILVDIHCYSFLPIKDETYIEVFPQLDILIKNKLRTANISLSWLFFGVTFHIWIRKHK